MWPAARDTRPAIGARMSRSFIFGSRKGMSFGSGRAVKSMYRESDTRRGCSDGTLDG
jgi:hypothetical protein